MRAGAVIPFLTVALLTGCATSSPIDTTATTTPSAVTPSATPEASPSTSAMTGSTPDRSKAFSLVVPDTWKPLKTSSPDIVLAVQAPTPTDKVVTTITVAARPEVVGSSLEDVVTDAATQMRQKAAKVSTVADRKVGGEPAKGYRVERSKEQDHFVQTQLFVAHAKKVYVITLTSAKSQESQARTTFDTTLATWAWAG